jgi:integrase
LFGYGCGARLGDVANLRWSSLDTAAGVASFKEGKTDKFALVGLHGDFLNWVADAKKVSDDPAAFVFPSLAGRTLGGEVGLSAEFSRLVEKAGIKTRLLARRQRRQRPFAQSTFFSLTQTWRGLKRVQ